VEIVVLDAARDLDRGPFAAILGRTRIKLAQEEVARSQQKSRKMSITEPPATRSVVWLNSFSPRVSCCTMVGGTGLFPTVVIFSTCAVALLHRLHRLLELRQLGLQLVKGSRRLLCPFVGRPGQLIDPQPESAEETEDHDRGGDPPGMWSFLRPRTTG